MAAALRGCLCSLGKEIHDSADRSLVTFVEGVDEKKGAARVAVSKDAPNKGFKLRLRPSVPDRSLSLVFLGKIHKTGADRTVLEAHLMEKGTEESQRCFLQVVSSCVEVKGHNIGTSAEVGFLHPFHGVLDEC